MQIKYDKKIDSKYISIKKGVVLRTQEIKDWLLVDYGKGNEILGIEVLRASNNLVSISTLNGVFSSASLVIVKDSKGREVLGSAETSKEKLLESEYTRLAVSYA